MASENRVLPPRRNEGEPAPPDDVYTPVEAAIDREAERAVCSRERSAVSHRGKAIVSVNGEDVADSNLQDGEQAA